MSWDTYVWKSTIIVSIITFIICMYTNGVNSLNASIAQIAMPWCVLLIIRGVIPFPLTFEAPCGDRNDPLQVVALRLLLANLNVF